MAAKSPTLSVKSREAIGVEQFSQRREVFDKHDTVFLPPSPPSSPTNYRDVEPIITSNRGKTTSNFKRNTPGYSSMRETRTDEQVYDFRPRKYSDNFTSELNQSDDVEYRHTMTERTRRLSKLRRDFMTSNLHEPGSNTPFNRSGTRASLPVNSSPIRYKIESPNLYKFPFAEPYSTPTPVRRVLLDLGPGEAEGKENQDPERRRHQSLQSDASASKVDTQKMFEELLKRYSPQRKPVDWQLPPTKPRIIASVPKSNSSVADSIDSGDRKINDEKPDKTDDDVFEKIETVENVKVDISEVPADKPDEDAEQTSYEEVKTNTVVIQNGPDALRPETSESNNVEKEKDPRVSQSELDEKNDEVPELTNYLQRQTSRESAKRPPLEKIVDLSIPALIEKMTAEGELENNKQKPTKVKRKRSFLDKLLGRNKETK